MSTETPLDEIEHTGARAKFLKLRRNADLPPGGEVTLKSEIEQIAKAMLIDVDESWTRERIMYEIKDTYYRREHDNRDGMPWTWQEYQAGRTTSGLRIARDLGYLTAQEAAQIANHLEKSLLEMQ